MNLLEIFLNEHTEIRVSGAGIKKTSYYGPLATLLYEIGKTLKPKIKSIMNLKGKGAEFPLRNGYV